MSWIDTHAHLADDAFDGIVDAVLQRAWQSDVRNILCVAVDAKSARGCIRLAEQHTDSSTHAAIWASAGIHPNHAHEASDEDWKSLETWIEHPRVCALGETGLDRHWDDCPFDVQRAAFDRHFELSRRTGLPLIIHMRDCEMEMLAALKEQAAQGALRGVMHSFAGSADTARRCVELGLYISFAGMLTYKKSDDLRAVAKTIPHDRLLVETDSPYLSPEPKRSIRPNEPAHVNYTASVLANATGLSQRELSQKTLENTYRLFDRMKH